MPDCPPPAGKPSSRLRLRCALLSMTEGVFFAIATLIINVILSEEFTTKGVLSQSKNLLNVRVVSYEILRLRCALLSMTTKLYLENKLYLMIL